MIFYFFIGLDGTLAVRQLRPVKKMTYTQENIAAFHAIIMRKWVEEEYSGPQLPQ
jgi:hypothetical protein